MRAIKLYLDNLCNIYCTYCNVDKKRKRKITDDEIINWFVENQENIDFSQIQLMGGEPTLIYNNKLFDFINDCFDNIYMTTNLYDEKLIEKWISRSREKISLTVSIHLDVFKKQWENILKYSDNIIKFNVIVTERNIDDLFDIVEKINYFNKPILLIPKNLKPHDSYKGFDKNTLKELIKQLIDNELHYNLLNYEFVEEARLGKIDYKENDCLKKSPLCIDMNGDIFSCEYSASFYQYNNNEKNIYGNILKNSIAEVEKEISKKLETCKVDSTCQSCKKCKSYGCSSKSSLLNSELRFSCEFHKTLYDYILYEHKYQFNLERCTLLLTEKCNMRCSYCFEGENRDCGYGNISKENIKRSLDLFFKKPLKGPNSVKHLSLFGGEPTLNIEGLEFIYEYIKELVDNKYPNPITIDINTNLYNFNENVQRVFKKIISIVPFEISVSIDLLKEVHDKHRVNIEHQPTYDVIMKNVLKLKEIVRETNKPQGRNKWVSIGFHSVITSDNIKYLELIIDKALYFYKTNFVDQVTIATPAICKSDQRFLNDGNYDDLVERVYKEEKKILEKYSNDDIDIINNEIGNMYLLTNRMGDIFSKYNPLGLTTCGLYNKMIAFRSNGEPIACHVFLTDSENFINKFLKTSYEEFECGITMNDSRFIILNLQRYLDKNLVEVGTENNRNCRTCKLKFACHLCYAAIKEIRGNKIIKFKDSCNYTYSRYNFFAKKNLPKIYLELETIKEENAMLREIIQKIIEGSD